MDPSCGERNLCLRILPAVERDHETVNRPLDMIKGHFFPGTDSADDGITLVGAA